MLHANNANYSHLDDRFGLAVKHINDMRRKKNLPDLDGTGISHLRNRDMYQNYIALLEAHMRTDLGYSLSLLQEWHVWHSE